MSQPPTDNPGKSTVTCNTCGVDNEVSARFCGSCGKDLSSQSKTSTSNPESSSTQPVAISPVTQPPITQPSSPQTSGQSASSQQETVSYPPPQYASQQQQFQQPNYAQYQVGGQYKTVLLTPTNAIKISLGVVIMAWFLTASLFSVFAILGGEGEFLVLYLITAGIPAYVAYRVMLEFMEPKEMVKAGAGFALISIVLYFGVLIIAIILLFSLFGGPF